MRTDVHGIDPAPPPPPTEAGERLRRGLMWLNRLATVPLMRAGLGAWFATPIGGYVLLMRVRGRTSGRIRDVPLSYLVAEGAPWVLAGWGQATQWYRNLIADPSVEVILPGRTLRCMAEEVRDPEVRRRILPALVRAAGLPGFMGGVDPRGPDQAILDAYAWVPLIRLRPVGASIAAGADDPGGTAWIGRQGLMLLMFTVVPWLTILGARRAAGRLTGGRNHADRAEAITGRGS